MEQKKCLARLTLHTDLSTLESSAYERSTPGGAAQNEDVDEEVADHELLDEDEAEVGEPVFEATQVDALCDSSSSDARTGNVHI